ncbi:MAG TPA: hypothetical protein VFC63_12865 [Blastocatellia bacterium]|nr:hypothetical protein [Blastocatellia bacterium]
MKSAVAFEGGLLKKTLALILAASLYVMFALPAFGAPMPYQATGTLVSTGNVVINSTEVPNGATVLPGSRITVKAPTQATINLGPLGKVDLAPNTDITLDFTGNSVTVTVNFGTVTLTTQSGINGEVKTTGATRVQVAQGQVSVKTDTKTDTVGAGHSDRTGGSADVTQSGPGTFTVSGQAPPLTGPTGPATGGTAAGGAAGSASLPTALTVIVIGGAVTGAIVAGVELGGRSEQVSPA